VYDRGEAICIFFRSFANFALAPSMGLTTLASMSIEVLKYDAVVSSDEPRFVYRFSKVIDKSNAASMYFGKLKIEFFDEGDYSIFFPIPTALGPFDTDLPTVVPIDSSGVDKIVPHLSVFRLVLLDLYLAVLCLFVNVCKSSASDAWDRCPYKIAAVTTATSYCGLSASRAGHVIVDSYPVDPT
jgi:hypothetical protein